MESPREMQFDPPSIPTRHSSTTDIEMQAAHNESHFSFDEKHAAASRQQSVSVPPLSRPQPVRKYSAKWWERTWNRAVIRGRWPRVIYSSVGLGLLLIWIGVMISFATNENHYERANSNNALKSYVGRAHNDSNSALSGLFTLKGNLVKFEPEDRALTITWQGQWQADASSEPIALGNSSVDDAWWPGGIGIFRDVDATPQTFSYSAADLGIDTTNTTNTTTTTTNDSNNSYNMYAVDNATAIPIAVIGQHVWDSFDTDISFGQVVTNAWLQPLFGYPFDEWQGNIVFVANMLPWAKMDNVTGGDVIELAGASLSDSTMNWRFQLTTTDTCASTNDYDYNNTDTWSPTCHLEIDLRARRPGLVIFAAMTALVVNWATTIFVFILTCESIIMRRGYMLEGTDLLSVCFTALFALPSVRSLLPGAPDFGAIIDLMGIIPNVIIISLCTCLVVVAKLYRTPESEAARAEKLAKEE